ncbi:sulfite exporter TauE/SafE family protein [Virgibacillus senegalensis]|uniref:sulfite exporter TauE/SafE family protein n=1 Tax=Virgibacillus senegalensis TaxID=1499679 RepID=UPI002D7694C9|nr:sulfite exporter TauE/SafE family protein [Virgibacillus senegalensis]
MAFIFELSLLQWMIVILCALFIGFAKAGIPSLGILVVTVMMFVFPAKQSVGILVPMLIIGDIFAVTYYRRNVVWKYLLSLLPWVMAGILSGYFVLDYINSDQLKPLIGVIVLSMVILHLFQSKMGEKFNQMLPESKWFTIFMGMLGGFTTMVGNAAGGVMAVYLLVKGLPKQEFIGTGAWFFLIVNLIKIPFYISLGLITINSALFNLWMAAAIIVGAFLGVYLIKLIPQKTFQFLVLCFAGLGAVRLLF